MTVRLGSLGSGVVVRSGSSRSEIRKGSRFGRGVPESDITVESRFDRGHWGLKPDGGLGPTGWSRGSVGDFRISSLVVDVWVGDPTEGHLCPRSEWIVVRLGISGSEVGSSKGLIGTQFNR